MRMMSRQKIPSFSVYRREFRDGRVETWSQKETIAWGPCTPPPTLETFSTKITASTRSSIEIGGLLKKKKMKKMKRKMARIREIAYERTLA